MTVLSGCIPNVKGTYAKELIYPSLFSLIIAPPASGKGVLKHSKTLGDDIHDRMLKQSREEEKAYQLQLEKFRETQRFKKKNETVIGGHPIQPPMKVPFIPANCSYAKILWHLDQNEGTGIICETEADTLGNVLKQEWGNYSDMLRKSFHHERLSSSKKTNNEFIEINNPRLAVALSGTPSQVLGLISSSEDGLFSRFIFYVYEVEPLWKDVSPRADGVNLNDFFKRLSVRVATLFDFLTEYETIVELSMDQWERLNSTCEKWLHQVTTFNGNESGSIVKRLGMIMFRIAMVLTAIRKYENTVKTTKVLCKDNDFEIALTLTQCYLEHSIFMYNNLPRQEKSAQFKRGSNLQTFYNELPQQFKRSKAIEIGKKNKLSERTVDGLLKKFLGKYLQQESFGMYSKIELI